MILRDFSMTQRAYLLMDITDGKYREVIRSLGNKPGVIMVDMLEGPPDILVVVEAGTRQELAELTVEALSSVENYAENVQLLPGRHAPGVDASRTRKEPSRSAGGRAPMGGT
jgi:hypothetical protein